LDAAPVTILRDCWDGKLHVSNIKMKEAEEDGEKVV
jgi:hypothetical protein